MDPIFTKSHNYEIIRGVGNGSVVDSRNDAEKEVKEVKEDRIDTRVDEEMEEKVKNLWIEDFTHFAGANDILMDAKKPL
ncbi:hypothetical protein L6452_30084 [Arctium lappa]|uniref:Uncharacterized protein n=1 Tax=Arctium lappa TaxID=4217 RepID=A0ACB8ZI03_ARCLA|nr:hypothetical protein L6452_30084 [Arctium lappa]